MQHSGMDMCSVAASETVAVPTPMLTNATLLPLATDPGCGTVLLNGGGTWIGHVGPGLVFVLWGLWWTVNMFLANFRQSVVGRLYCSGSYYPSPWRHARSVRCFKHWEAVTMVWGPIFMVWLELRGDHTTYTNMLCSNGRFDPRHLHNWQHTASYPGFFVSGIVNLVGNYLTLPPGTQHSFLGLAFSIEGAVMVMHTKHHPLDAVVHWLLGMTMLTTAAFVFLEIKAPHSLLVSVARSGSLMLTGAWLCVMGKMLYTDVRFSLWAEDNMASSMMAPAVFAMLLLAVAVFQLVLYLVMETLYKRFSHGKFTYTSLPVLHSPEALQPSGKLDAAMLGQHDIDSRDDSAHQHTDTGSDRSSSQAGCNSTASQHAAASVPSPQSKQPKAVSSVLAALVKPVKGTLGNPSLSKSKADHVV